MLLDVSDVRNAIEKHLQDVAEWMSAGDYAAVFADAAVRDATQAVLRAARLWVDENDSVRRLSVLRERRAKLDRDVAAAAPLLAARREELEAERRAALALAEEEKKHRVSKPREARTKGERIHLANSSKQKGNAVFKELDYAAAAAQYINGLSYLRDLYDLSPEEEAEVNSLRVQLNVNTATCCFKLDRFAQALENCNDALRLEPGNVKALFRRSQCHIKLKDFAAAVADLKLALDSEPSNRDLANQLAAAQKLVKLQKDQQRKMYAKMFV